MLFDNPTMEKFWASLSIENVETILFMDLDTLGEEEPNLDSLNIEMKLGNAKLAGEAENVDHSLDLDLTDILNNV